MFHTKATPALLALLVLCGLVLRLVALNDPVTYDEAYTYVGFASHGLWAALSDYSLPNNHILHTVLVWAATGLLGNSVWVLRLPALLAGLASIPAVYLLGKTLYNHETGLLAAALVAWFPELVRYSSEARGYSLLGLFSLLVFYFGVQALRHDSWRNWLALALCNALGFFTLPLMLYPAGGLYLWLALEGPKTRRFYTRWLLSGLGSGVLIVLFYTPALLVSGWRRLLANGFVQPVDAERYFDWVLVTRLVDTWSAWNRDVTLALSIFLVLGFFLSLAFHTQIQPSRWPLSLVLLGWVATLVLTRRPEAFDRFWSWLLAPCLLWAAAGLVAAARRIPSGRIRREEILVGVALLGLVAQGLLTLPAYQSRWQKIGNQQAAAEYLAANLQPGDVVLVGYPNEAQVWYYLRRQGLPETVWQPREGAERYWLLRAANQEGQTLQGIIRTYQLNPARQDLPGAVLRQKYGKIEIHLVLPRP